MLQSRIALCAAAVLALAGCSGIGEGTKPVSARIVQVPMQGTLTTESVTGPQVDGRAFTCVRSSLQLFVIFSDGSIGNFTNRAVWSTSDTAVVGVSNFDEVVPSNTSLRFPFGSLSPKAVGQATITARAIGLEASLPVEVVASGDLRVTPLSSRSVPQTTRLYTAEAQLDDEWVDVSLSTDFRFTSDDDNDTLEDEADPTDADNFGIFVLGSDGRPRLVSRAVSDPLEVRASLNVPGCGGTGADGSKIATATAQIADIPAQAEVPPTGLRLEYDPGDGLPPAFGAGLAEGTSQLLRLFVRFGDFNSDGDTLDEDEFQDVTSEFSQSEFAVDRDRDGLCELTGEDVGTAEAPLPTQVFSVGTVLAGFNQLTALVDSNVAVGDVPGNVADEASLVCARFGRDVDLGGVELAPGVLSNTLPITVIDRPLTQLIPSAVEQTTRPEPADDACPATFNPLAPCIQAGTLLTLRAVGQFQNGDEDPSGPTDVHEQTITRHVSWSVDNTTAALIGPLRVTNTSSLGSGQLLALNLAAGSDPVTVTVTVTYSQGTVTTTDDVTRTIPVVIMPAPAAE